MIDPTDAEAQAVHLGGQQGGEYLDALGKFDLRTLTKEEWSQFLLCIVGGYHDHLAQLQAEDAE